VIIEKDHENEIKDTLIKIDKILKTKSISTIVLQNYFGREYGGFQNIEKKEIENRVKGIIYEAFNIEIGVLKNKLVLCQWEYPGPKPDKNIFLLEKDIPNNIQDLEGNIIA